MAGEGGVVLRSALLGPPVAGDGAGLRPPHAVGEPAVELEAHPGGVRAHRGEEGSDKEAEAAKLSAGATGGSHENEKRRMREGRETDIEARRLGRLLQPLERAAVDV